MITVLLVNQDSEVIIRHYDTASEDEACRRMVMEWKNDTFHWEWESSNSAFTDDFLDSEIKSQLNDYTPDYINGVRHMVWHCCPTQYESDDEIVHTYFVHSNHANEN